MALAFVEEEISSTPASCWLSRRKIHGKRTPAALNEDSITGRAFIELAENVVKQTEKRNAEQAPTHIVEMKK